MESISIDEIDWNSLKELDQNFFDSLKELDQDYVDSMFSNSEFKNLGSYGSCASSPSSSSDTYSEEMQINLYDYGSTTSQSESNISFFDACDTQINKLDFDSPATQFDLNISKKSGQEKVIRYKQNSLERAKSKLTRTRTLLKKASELSKICNLNVAVVILDKKVLKTFFSNESIQDVVKISTNKEIKKQIIT
jgi:hypothetical protein